MTLNPYTWNGRGSLYVAHGTQVHPRFRGCFRVVFPPFEIRPRLLGIPASFVGVVFRIALE